MPELAKPRLSPPASPERFFLWSAILFAAALCGPVAAQTAPGAPIDYAQPATWVCRPGEETACTSGQDAMVINAEGQRSPESFRPAADPPIDCFYVYPTISLEPTPYADMADGPEVQEVTRAQAGRLTSRCRLYAPIYRQITMAGLRQSMMGGARLDPSGPYGDILAAWRWYMAHENHGRGVVLIGHSQGAIILQRLIAEEIDGKAIQGRLVAAFLAGDPVLPVPRGAKVGGAFQHVPLCSAAAQIGCVYVWADYLATDASPRRNFGRHPGGSVVAACVNPAAPGGGPGELVAYLPKPKAAPAEDPSWVKVKGQLTGECVSDPQGAYLRVTTQATPLGEFLHDGLDKYVMGPGWGLHRLDLSLPQGNILEVVEAETGAWTRR